MAAAFKDLWRSYCARHKVPDTDRNFALDLMDRASHVMRERAAQVAEEFGGAPPNPEGRRAALAATIRALTEG